MKKRNLFQTLMSFAGMCKGKMILAVLFAVLSVFGGIIPFFAVYSLIEEIMKGNPDAGALRFWCLMCVAGFLVHVSAYAVSTTFAHISAYTILEQIRIQMAKRLLNAPLGEVTAHSAGRMKDVFLDKVSTIELPLAHVIPEVGAGLILPLAMFFYLITIDWRMALATLATLPLCMMPMTDKKKRELFHEKYAAYMKANEQVNNVIVEYIEGIEVVKTFHQTASSYEKFAGAVKSFRHFTLDWYQNSRKGLTMLASVLPSTLLFTVPIGLWLFIKGSLSVSEFTVCCILALGLIAPLIKFTTYVNMGKTIEYALLAADEILSMPVLQAGNAYEIPKEYSISLKDVRFSYTDENGKEVLHGINLDIRQGKVTALVGPSGSGKSTIARLIDRFWDMKEGSITIGNVDVRNIPLPELSNIVSFVTQDNFLFHCSLKENIRIGKQNATDDEVYDAAKAAQCEEFVRRLEHGWDTLAGEAGRFLSGGEKQRIALARAILKDAPIVILDEATAFTDPQNEEKIQKAIMRLSKGKTLLVIAHRLSTVKNADQIAVLEKGNVVGLGTHDELVTNCPLYERLWHAHTGAKKWALSSKREERYV